MPHGWRACASPTCALSLRRKDTTFRDTVNFAADRQFGLDARAADHRRGDDADILTHARALRRQVEI